MKNTLYKNLALLITILSIGILIGCSSCDDFNSSKKYPIENTHRYHDGHQHEESNTTATTAGFDASKIDNIKDRYSNENRQEWQQPHLVLSMFGNLTDKVIADIGAGPEGYFTLFLAGRTKAEKIIALDIDPKALDFINEVKKGLGEASQARIETRLAGANSSNLKDAEVDGVLISETLIYIDDPVAYLSKLREGLKKGGKLLVIDFKMKQIPTIFPPVKQRMPLYKMENIIEQAGFKRLATDDMSLPFHYMVLCENR